MLGELDGATFLFSANSLFLRYLETSCLISESISDVLSK